MAEGKSISKSAEEARFLLRLQNRLTGALIGLSRAIDITSTVENSTFELIIDSLLSLSNKNSIEDDIIALTEKINAEKRKFAPNCSSCAFPCGRNNDYDMADFFEADEDTRNVKLLILMALRSLAVDVRCADAWLKIDDSIIDFILKALFALGEDWSADMLRPIAAEAGKMEFELRQEIFKSSE